MKNFIRLIVILLAVVFTFTLQARAEEADFLTDAEIDWLKNKKVLKIGNQMNWPPFDFNENGVPKGYAIDHIKAITKTLGVELEFVFGYDWHTLIENFKAGKVDVMPVFFVNNERKKFTLYTQSYYKGKIAVFTRGDNIGMDLTGKKVGMEKAHGSIPVVKKLLPDVDLIEVPTKKELIQKLATKQLDAIIANPFVIHHVAKKNEVTNLVVSSFLNLSKKEEEASAFHIGVNKNLPILRNILDKAIAHMGEEEREAIENKWANISIVKGTDWILVVQVAGCVALLILFLLWNIKIHRAMVHAKTKELNKLNEELELKVFERTHTLEQKNEQLKIAQRNAEIANQAKSQFLANMSHELRTPLNAVAGFSELLSSIVTDEKQKSYLEAIKTAGASLLTLINDILDLSKIEAGKFELQKSSVDIRSVFREVEQLFTLKMAEKNLTFHIEIQENIPSALLLDEVRTRQILMNLLSNAIKFTEAGHVTLAARVEYKGQQQVDLLLYVEDSGIGISEEDHTKIFDVFTQQSGQSVEKYGGTGLGLTITKRLVELMEGHISVQSTQNQGSTFSVRLKGTEIIMQDTAVDTAPAYEVDDIQFEKALVLVADDIASNRTLLTEVMAKFNLDCITAKNGQEALLLAREKNPALIILDIRMPVMNGYETVRHLKKNPATKDIPVIALTASATKEDEGHGLQCGFVSFLPKPIKMSNLASELSHHLPFSIKNTQKASAPAVGDTIIDPKGLCTSIQNKVIPTFHRQKKAMVMEELREFADMLRVLGSKHKASALLDYAQNLDNDIKLFDVAAIEEKFETFEQTCKDIADSMEP